MKYAFLILLFVQTASKPAPTPTPDNQFFTHSNSVFISTSHPTVMMNIYSAGDKIIEINANGKHLIVFADGKIDGDLPHDAAADTFWQLLANNFPDVCNRVARKEKD